MKRVLARGNRGQSGAYRLAEARAAHVLILPFAVADGLLYRYETGPHTEVRMAMYLTRFSYTPETWARLIQKPEDRRAAAQAYIESVGGKLHGFWYAFGENDGWNLWEAPDNVSMAAVALAIGAGGALRSIETTVLLTVEELTEALGKAKSVGYRPPGA